jgi:hypothetical protein
MDLSKLSDALLEVFCALSFVVCGVVVGFCLGGLLGPRLFGHGGQGLEEIGFMLNGAILGACLGAAAAAAALKLPRLRRQRIATSALALAAMTALFTAIAVKHFNAW